MKKGRRDVPRDGARGQAGAGEWRSALDFMGQSRPVREIAKEEGCGAQTVTSRTTCRELSTSSATTTTWSLPAPGIVRASLAADGAFGDYSTSFSCIAVRTLAMTRRAASIAIPADADEYTAP